MLLLIVPHLLTRMSWGCPTSLQSGFQLRPRRLASLARSMRSVSAQRCKLLHREYRSSTTQQRDNRQEVQQDKSAGYLAVAAAVGAEICAQLSRMNTSIWIT